MRKYHPIVQYYLRPHPGMKNYLRFLGYQHHQYGANIEDYMAFEVTLLSTLGVLHGERWNDDIAMQWREAFQMAVQIMKEGHRDDFVPS